MKKINLILILLIASSFVMAQTDNCLNFDGVDDYVFIGDRNDLGTSDFTIESWIFLENTIGNGNKIINKGLTSVGIPSNAGYALRASKTGTDEIEFQIGNMDASTKRVIYNGITSNEWHHVAGVRSKQKLYLYLDGVLVAEDSTATIYNVDTDIPLVIGAIHKGGLSPINEFMDGKIDEVRIWDIARSESEINNNKDCAIISPESNLLAVYNLNENTLTTAFDSSGNSNNGNLVNGPIFISSAVAPICLVGREELYDKQALVYPNPFQSEIYVKDVLSNTNFKIIQIYGHIVISGKLNGNRINTNELSSGSYILEIYEGVKVKRVKVIKK